MSRARSTAASVSRVYYVARLWCATSTRRPVARGGVGGTRRLSVCLSLETRLLRATNTSGLWTLPVSCSRRLVLRQARHTHARGSAAVRPHTGPPLPHRPTPSPPCNNALNGRPRACRRERRDKELKQKPPYRAERLHRIRVTKETKQCMT